MARSTMSPAVCMLLACLALAFAAQSMAATYPKCPFTGLAPKKPTIPHTRCLGANQLSCCEDCADISYGLTVVSANVSTILCALPGLGAICQGFKGKPGDVQLCGVFVGTEQCLGYMEQLVCALSCNPDSGNYVKNGTSTTYMYDLYVCSTFAQEVYAACKGLQLPGFPGTLQQVLPSASDFLSTVFGGIATALNQFTFQTIIVNDTTSCFNGDNRVANTSVCCDPLTVSPSCPPTAVNFTAHPEWKPFSGRTVDPKVCKANATSAPGPSNSPAGGTDGAVSPPSGSTSPPPPSPKQASKSYAPMTSVLLVLGVTLLMAHM